MNNELSILYQEIYKKKIDLLSDKDPALLNKIKSELADAYGQGELNELHYNLLKDKLDVLTQTPSKKDKDDNAGSGTNSLGSITERQSGSPF